MEHCIAIKEDMANVSRDTPPMLTNWCGTCRENIIKELTSRNIDPTPSAIGAFVAGAQEQRANIDIPWHNLIIKERAKEHRVHLENYQKEIEALETKLARVQRPHLEKIGWGEVGADGRITYSLTFKTRGTD